MLGRHLPSLVGGTQHHLLPVRHNETTVVRCAEYMVHPPVPRLVLLADMALGESAGRDLSRMLFRMNRGQNSLSLSWVAWWLSVPASSWPRQVVASCDGEE